ncbi:NAD(+) diphosphatase [Pseudokineococcus lusitanus]|uniref:NAD(+) diphosphatase n=1 Tax=Pseudokineococcus lusitanus TaxID=763993 RepID=A0A3N1HN17_9ACTN|nr:NAD(+) diphosphatase [Pseudokineococcus lusitanus]ROP43913.1 NAD+ diphosphatase [Pseudokineococcus lusitanus]
MSVGESGLGPLLLSRADLDRDGVSRTRPDLLRDLWADPSTRVLRVRPDGSAPVRGATGAPTAGTPDAGALALELVAPRDVAPVLPEDQVVVYLGRSDEGEAFVAVEVAAEQPVADGAGWPVAAGDERWAGLREVGALLDDRGSGLLVEAVGVLNWHRVTTHCPRCGARTAVTSAGWTRSCPVDGSEHYPRTDPAVIMAVVDDRDRVLLAHNALWPEGRYSALAGFVEPGEPLEAAVRREVLEEVGVVVGEVTYRGSQPWPFPASLMLGFTARASSTDVRVDEVEIAAARWFTRAELAAAVTAGEVRLPPPTSIALRLVEAWFTEGGDPMPAAEGW